jgi:squalene cyclase
VVQTAWALLTLCDAQDPDFDAVERAARFIARAQLGSGEWPQEEPVGLFFRTALLDYALYRSYFPLWALAAYEARRATRGTRSTRTRSYTRMLAPPAMASDPPAAKGGPR